MKSVEIIVVIIVPNPIHKSLCLHYLIRMPEQFIENNCFNMGKLNFHISNPKLLRSKIQGAIPYRYPRILYGSIPVPIQEGLYPDYEFYNLKRLSDVVIGA